MSLSVPANSSPRRNGSFRTTRAKLPLGWFVARPSAMRVHDLPESRVRKTYGV
jgi:hypothetical protein